MPATTKKSGFLSQRNFNRYMKTFEQDASSNKNITDPVSRNLAASGKEKGRKGEYIVCGMFRDMGYDSVVLSGHDRCDVLVNIDGKWLNVEVKTAGLSNSRTRQYNFNHIKPQLFDLIALVFVGDEGTSVQIGGHKAKCFIYNWATKTGTEYKLTYNKTRRHCKDRGNEGTWFNLTAENMQKIVSS